MVGMRPSSYKSGSDPRYAVRRIGWFFVAVAAIIGVFWVRAFYLQVIKHEHYVQAAKRDQMKEYQIPAPRGVIRAHNGDDLVPIVLNQKLYTVYADPVLIKDADKAAQAAARVLGGDESEYKKKLTAKDTRYVVLAKKIAEDKNQAILRYKSPGVGAQEISYRTYPNGSLAAQLLGFVNDEGAGVYGIEQALDELVSPETRGDPCSPRRDLADRGHGHLDQHCDGLRDPAAGRSRLASAFRTVLRFSITHAIGASAECVALPADLSTRWHSSGRQAAESRLSCA